MHTSNAWTRSWERGTAVAVAFLLAACADPQAPDSPAELTPYHGPRAEVVASGVDEYAVRGHVEGTGRSTRAHWTGRAALTIAASGGSEWGTATGSVIWSARPAMSEVFSPGDRITGEVRCISVRPHDFFPERTIVEIGARPRHPSPLQWAIMRFYIDIDADGVVRFDPGMIFFVPDFNPECGSWRGWWGLVTADRGHLNVGAP